MTEIERMQLNLLLIRRTVGWSAAEFGDRIGVTRQTINNIESGRNKLTKTQYIAMRSVIDAEIATNPKETEMLVVLLDVTVDNPEKYSNEEKAILLEKANLLTPSILAGTASRAAVSNEWMKSVGALGIAVAGLLSGVTSPFVTGALVGSGVAGAVSSWLIKAIQSTKKKKN